MHQHHVEDPKRVGIALHWFYARIPHGAITVRDVAGISHADHGVVQKHKISLPVDNHAAVKNERQGVKDVCSQQTQKPMTPHGIRLPTYITECGIWAQEWNSIDPFDQLKQYDNAISKLWYIAGAHIYVNPWDPPYDQYPAYYPQYKEYAESVKDRENG